MRIVLGLLVVVAFIGFVGLLTIPAPHSGDFSRIELHELPDGTMCAVYRESITCNWRQPGPTARFPPTAGVTVSDGRLEWSRD